MGIREAALGEQQRRQVQRPDQTVRVGWEHAVKKLKSLPSDGEWFGRMWSGPDQDVRVVWEDAVRKKPSDGDLPLSQALNAEKHASKSNNMLFFLSQQSSFHFFVNSFYIFD